MSPNVKRRATFTLTGMALKDQPYGALGIWIPQTPDSRASPEPPSRRCWGTKPTNKLVGRLLVCSASLLCHVILELFIDGVRANFSIRSSPQR